MVVDFNPTLTRNQLGGQKQNVPHSNISQLLVNLKQHLALKTMRVEGLKQSISVEYY